MSAHKDPNEYAPEELETIDVGLVDGVPVYTGRDTPLVKKRAKATPIMQLGSSIVREVVIFPGQEAFAYERQWLLAVWRQDIAAWTVDHP